MGRLTWFIMKEKKKETKGGKNQILRIVGTIIAAYITIFPQVCNRAKEASKGETVVSRVQGDIQQQNVVNQNSGTIGITNDGDVILYNFTQPENGHSKSDIEVEKKNVFVGREKLADCMDELDNILVRINTQLGHKDVDSIRWRNELIKVVDRINDIFTSQKLNPFLDQYPELKKIWLENREEVNNFYRQAVSYNYSDVSKLHEDLDRTIRSTLNNIYSFLLETTESHKITDLPIK